MILCTWRNRLNKIWRVVSWSGCGVAIAELDCIVHLHQAGVIFHRRRHRPLSYNSSFSGNHHNSSSVHRIFRIKFLRFLIRPSFTMSRVSLIFIIRSCSGLARIRRHALELNELSEINRWAFIFARTTNQVLSAERRCHPVEIKPPASY